MSHSVIGAQLYTLRDFTQTPADIAKTLKRVKTMGYDAVQLSALGPIAVTELKKILDGEGLVAAATHVSFEKMRDETEKVIEDHHLLECKHPAVGSMPGEFQNETGFHQFAKEASAVARKLKTAELSFSYHNHSFELGKFGDTTGLDILFNESDATVFNFEIDTYWIQHGGSDPAAWIKKGSNRIPIVHFKDMVIQEKKQIMAEVGEGNLNWPAILDACKTAGVEWYLVEQDICQRDPFESLAISLRNMKSWGLA
ncbi:sugar phosphate isomerase/epimerase [bacterium]|nr:sugar phosphate isomerase/epimerase [bacterium]